MRRNVLVAFTVVLSLLGVAAAQTIGIGTPSAGSFMHSSGIILAKVANEKTGLAVTVQPFASATVFVPALNSGDLQFGYINAYEGLLAYEGQGFFAGRQNRDIRAVAVTYPLRSGLFVRKNSPIKTIADLKGRHVPSEYTGMKTVVPILDAAFATAGLTFNDMKPVPVPNVVASADLFSAGRLDMFLFALGSAKVREVDANVAGGIRSLSIDNTPASVAAIKKHYPVGYLRLEEPGPANPGITEPTYCIAYDALLFASAKTPDDVVYKITKAMYENKAELMDGFPGYKMFEPSQMVKDIHVPYHPGAIKFYKEKGLWPPR